jgi:hypothetical protein
VRSARYAYSTRFLQIEVRTSPQKFSSSLNLRIAGESKWKKLKQLADGRDLSMIRLEQLPML